MKENLEQLTVEENQIYSWGFKTVVIIMALLMLGPIFASIMGIMEQFMPGSPVYFHIIIIALSILGIVCAFMIYQLKKWAVYTYSIAVLCIILLYAMGYNIYYQDAIFPLFFFTGFGLFVILPRWKYFK